MRQLLIATVLGEKRPQHLTREGLEKPVIKKPREIATAAHPKRDEEQEGRKSQLDVEEAKPTPKRATGAQKLVAETVEGRLQFKDSSKKLVEVPAHLQPKLTYWRIDNQFIWVGKAQGKSAPLVGLPRLLDERIKRMKEAKELRRSRQRERQRRSRRRQRERRRQSVAQLW